MVNRKAQISLASIFDCTARPSLHFPSCFERICRRLPAAQECRQWRVGGVGHFSGMSTVLFSGFCLNNSILVNIQRTKHCKSDARAIALRTKEILDVIADAVPDGSRIPQPMLRSIQRFTMWDESMLHIAVLTKLCAGFSKRSVPLWNLLHLLAAYPTLSILTATNVRCKVFSLG